MRFHHLFASLWVLALSVGGAAAQTPFAAPAPTIPPKYKIYKAEDVANKWIFYSDADDTDVVSKSDALKAMGYEKADCGNGPMKKSHTICLAHKCPENQYDLNDDRCPSKPRPVMVPFGSDVNCSPIVVLTPVACPLPTCQPCVTVCPQPACERPRLFPLFRRCR
jgi:hypothetical protein